MKKLNINMVRNFYDYIIYDDMTYINMFEPNYDVAGIPDGKYQVRSEYTKIFFKNGNYLNQKVLHFYNDDTDVGSFTVTNEASIYLDFEEAVTINSVSIYDVLDSFKTIAIKKIIELDNFPSLTNQIGKAIQISNAGISFSDITFSATLDVSSIFPTDDNSYIPSTKAIKDHIDGYGTLVFDDTYSEVTNLNTITDSGIYICSGSVTNAPNIAETFFGLICINQKNKILQVVYTTNNKKYVRTYINSNWTDWSNKNYEIIKKNKQKEDTEYKRFIGDIIINTWNQHKSGNESNSWISVCWSPELSMFVSVATTGTNRIQYSYDGINWTAVPSGNDTNAWRSVTWSPELSMFVAVASLGVNSVQYSYDGINWTTTSSGDDSNFWYSVCWSPELAMFVAVAYSGTNRVQYSYDGINWTLTASGNESNTWRSVTWSPELAMFVAVAGAGANSVQYSYDGINWTAVASGNDSNTWRSVTWSPELAMFVSVASNGTNRVQYSYDGINWTAVLSGNESNEWYSVVWSSELSMFVSVAYSGANLVQYSYDGINWTAVASAVETNGWSSICWNSELSMFVAISQIGTKRVMTSRKLSSIIG